MEGNDRGALRPFQGGGLEWTVAAGDDRLQTLLSLALLSWGRIPEDPATEVLKSNRMRTVLSVDPLLLAGAPAPPGPHQGRWIIKQYRHADWPDRLRYRFVPSRAAREWDALRRVRALGFTAPRPLAFGERRVGGVPLEGGLVMEEVSGATSVLDRLRRLLPDGERGPLPEDAARLLSRTGALVRAFHDRGVDHPDLHPGNLLLSAAPGAAGEGGPGQIHLIDLHSARFRRRLSRRRRRMALARLVHSLRASVPPAGIRELLRAYLGPAEAPTGSESEVERLASALGARAERIEARRMKSRSRRCLMPSTGFAVERLSGGRLHRRREVPPEHLALLLREPPPGALRKAGPEGWVAGVEVEGRGYLVKRRRYSLLSSLRGLVLDHRLRGAFRAGFLLEVHGVPTPRVLLLREERRLGLVRAAWLVTELVPDAVGLSEYLWAEFHGKTRRRGEAARRKRLLARRTGALIRAVHDAGIATHDFSPQNILVSPSRLREELEGRFTAGAAAPPEPGRAVLIADLDGVQAWRRPDPRRRERNLVQAGNLPEGHVSWADRLRSLHAYARGEAELLSPEVIGRLREGLLREAERTLERMLAGDAPPAARRG